MKELDGAPNGGARFPITARIDNRVYMAFHLDVGLGDAVIAPPEWLVAQDFLGFAEIPPPRIAVLPREQQFAEKIHAYTLPRAKPNTRVKDLVDLVLLIQLGLTDLALVARAVAATFARRATHPIPRTLEPPPPAWAAQYVDLALECDLAQTTTEAAFALVTGFWYGIASAPPDHI